MEDKNTSPSLSFKAVSVKHFKQDVYQPGVISAARIIWGSLGSAGLLGVLAILSNATGISVLYPPLAATCFITSTCVYLRAARPKQVIVGHSLAAICGLAGSWAGMVLAGGTSYAIPCKLGAALLLATIFMQLFDADHPPAAATAAIPAILPLPMAPLLFPLYMAWGATVTVLFALFWNRIWFDFPPKSADCCSKNSGFYMNKNQIKGFLLCSIGAVLLCANSVIPFLYQAGIPFMISGVVVLGTEHFIKIKS